MLLLTGIVSGLVAALFQSGSYVFTRLFVLRQHRGPVDLLIVAHLLMGAGSLLLVPLVWSDQIPPISAYAWPLTGTALYYVIGQIGLFRLMRTVEASKVAPLLALKIVILAVFTTTVMDQRLSALQWMAVFFSVLATWTLTQSGVRLSPPTFGLLLVTCTGYSLSDLSIQQMVIALRPLGPIHASIVGVCFSYALCGALALAVCPWIGGRAAIRQWKHAVPFAACWYGGMVFLFACFACIGAVYGNILQSTRGLISILLGAALAHLGYVELEEKTGRAKLLRRLASATLMTLAIWLFQR